MATTTNFGWETPDDTDLVKDGAAAIRTLGSSIDTTTKALNPSTTLGDIEYRSSTANTNTRLPIGTTGQVLAVVGGVPAWATTADQTPLTTKGDIFTFTTVDARLGVGANGTVLTADSAEATGLKWATPSSTPTAVGCSISNSVSQSIDNSSTTTLTFNTEDYDTDGFHSTSTNTGRITIPAGKAGKYFVSTTVNYAGNATGFRQIRILKNGSTNVAATVTTPGDSGDLGLTCSVMLTLAEADYLTVVTFQNSGNNLNVYGNNEWNYDTIFGVNFLGA